MNFTAFQTLNELFEANGFRLLLVGGAVRDHLLHREARDYDFVTNARPEQVQGMFPDADLSFARFGFVRVAFEGERVDIVTMRKERYEGTCRHPSEISYVSDPREDAMRRDFTVNALYMDAEGTLYDFFDGAADVTNRILRFIGDPEVRIEEDPLRILRAIRFCAELDFTMSEETKQSVVRLLPLLKRISGIQLRKELQRLKEVPGDAYARAVMEYRLDSYIVTEERNDRMPDIIDLHCDTITELFHRGGSLMRNDLHVDINKLTAGGYGMQCFAVFVNLKDGEPWKRCLEYIGFYRDQLVENASFIKEVRNVGAYASCIGEKKLGAMLTVEEGGVLEGDIRRLDELYRLGVRMMTLTWNYPNEIGRSNYHPGIDFYEQTPDREHGLTEFGKAVVKRMNDLGMIVDVSHLSDAGFYDVLRLSRDPVVASHSNARAVWPVIRNLDDEMILALHQNGGVMGMNYCPDFVSGNPEQPVEDIVAHILHIRDLGCIDAVALGSDFDGIPTPRGLSDASRLPLLYQCLKRSGLTEEEIEKIFYKNFLRVMKKVLK